MNNLSKPPRQWRGACLGQIIAFAALCTMPACLHGESEQQPWDPRPLILTQAREVHPKLDVVDLSWDSDPLVGTPLETWTLEGPYLHGWLVTGWTVDRENQTVHMDWSKIEEVR